MKKEKRKVLVDIDIQTAKVENENCPCPAGQSGYCNHVMALHLELLDYSLKQIKCVPEEVACTSIVRQWSVPGESSYKIPVMETIVQKQTFLKSV